VKDRSGKLAWENYFHTTENKKMNQRGVIGVITLRVSGAILYIKNVHFYVHFDLLSLHIRAPITKNTERFSLALEDFQKWRKRCLRHLLAPTLAPPFAPPVDRLVCATWVSDQAVSTKDLPEFICAGANTWLDEKNVQPSKAFAPAQAGLFDYSAYLRLFWKSKF
jgi:hypothetical protein